LDEFYGVANFTETAFSIMMVATTLVRGMVLGGMASSPSQPVPVKPWISFQNYNVGPHGPRDQVKRYLDNDFWQEGLLHMAVSGVPQFHHFNDWMNVDGATQQNQLLQDCLDEMGSYLGCSNRTWVADRSFRWADDFVLTGSDVGAHPAGARVWRFTPSRPEDFAPEIERPTNAGLTRGNVTVAVNVKAFGKVQPCTIRFGNATITQGGASAFGWWILQGYGAPDPTVNCSGRLSTWPLPVAAAG